MVKIKKKNAENNNYSSISIMYTVYGATCASLTNREEDEFDPTLRKENNTVSKSFIPCFQHFTIY